MPGVSGDSATMSSSTSSLNSSSSSGFSLYDTLRALERSE